MRQHPLVCFYLMAFGWTWVVDLLILGLWRQPAGASGAALRIIIPILIGAPTFPAFLMTALTEGRVGMGRLLSLLVPPGGIVALREPVPALVLSYLPVFIVIFLVGGPLPEEPAWRGFALPRLEQRLGPLGGTLLLGLLWGLWHFPSFLFIPGFIGISLPFVEFVIGTVALAVIFTWVFHNTHGSLLLTMLLHASENTVIGAVFATQVGYLSLYLVYIVVAVLIIAATRGRLSYEGDLRETMSSASLIGGEQKPGAPDTSDDGFHKP